MSREHIDDRLLERAAELWCRALRLPTFNNGDSSERGLISMGLAGIVADKAIARVADYPAAVERFRSKLVENLKYLRDHDGEETGEQGPRGPKHVYFDGHLGSDYGPDDTLAVVADAAGVPRQAFPFKSTMNFYTPGCVCTSFGYAASPLYHYPLPDDAWLICGLHGGDMPAIIAAVVDGRLPELTVERPVATR